MKGAKVADDPHLDVLGPARERLADRLDNPRLLAAAALPCCMRRRSDGRPGMSITGNDPTRKGYARESLIDEDPDVAELLEANRDQRRRQALRLAVFGVGLCGAGALVLWRVSVYAKATGWIIVEVPAIGAGCILTGMLLLILAAVLALRS